VPLFGNAPICASTVLECSCSRILRYVASPHKDMSSFFADQLSHICTQLAIARVQILVLKVSRDFITTTAEPEFVNLSRSPRIDSQPGGPELEFLNNLLGARNREGMGLSYRPARLHRLAEFIPWNRFLGSINV
jgi:hypothetical protein